MAYREDPFAGRRPRVACFGRIGGAEDDLVDLVAICEADAALRAKYGQMGLAVYEPDQMRDMVERDDIDMVTVKTPNYVHTEQTIAALDAGKHVWVEKPLGISHEEVDAITAARERSGKAVQVNLELRNSEMFVRVREIMAELGLEPMHVFWHVRDFNKVTDEGGQKPTPWRMRRELSGGYLLEKMIHYVDQCIWWMGRRVERVRTFAPPVVTSRYQGILDNICLNLVFEGGPTGMLHWTQFGGHDQVYDFGIVGRQGAVLCRWLDRREARMEITVCDSVLDDEGRVIKTPLRRRECYRGRDRGIMSHDSPGCLRMFIDYLRGKRAHQTVPFADAVHTMRVVLAGEESAGAGEDVVVRQA